MEAPKPKLVLFGDGSFAEVACEYFTHDSPYEVVAFTVSRSHLKRSSLMGRPVLPFEELERECPPGEYAMHLALVYGGLNALRARFYGEAKAKGYRLANYVSSRAFLWPNVTLGDNCFVFENNVLQPFVRVGSDVVLWSGNHVGHHSRIGDHVFLSSHVVISGHVEVGERCFLGVNATVVNHVRLGERSVVGAGALVVKDVPPDSVIRGRPCPPGEGERPETLGFLRTP